MIRTRLDGSGKTGFLKILVLVLCGIYALYLFNLQVIRYRDYAAQVQKYAVQSVKIPATRGEIFDRTHTSPLVTNDEAFSVELVPAEIPAAGREELFARIATSLGMDVEEIHKKIPPKYYHLYQPISVSMTAAYSTVIQIAEHKEDFPGVYWNSRPVRKYVDVGSLAHVLGYVGEIGRDEYKILYNKGYAQDDMIGKAGIEKFYDSIMKGKDGRLLKTVDVKGKDLSATQDQIEAPVAGKSLVLTIDNSIQKIAERALGARMGSVIVLKPSSGEVLAMVSFPWYDPNLFLSSGSGNEYAKLLSDANKPLLNRAVQSSYPPASTFKTVLTAALLEGKGFLPTQKVLCRGVLDYGGRDWNCWIHRPGHGSLDLAGALAQSCDIYYWTVGRDVLGAETILSYAGDFGYGKLTGIDLPGENAGFIPTPKWKEQTYNERWTLGDTMNISIGQGYLLSTPLQVANMIAMIANDGIVYRPHLVKEIRDTSTGALIESVGREQLSKSSISKETFENLRKDLRGVITNGTARAPMSTKVVQIAGKTGTAEVGLKDRWHSWFASYGPYDAPPDEQIVVVTMIEATNPWEWWAPYAANVIYQAIFGGQDVEAAAKTVGVSLSSSYLRGRTE
jgi:penicillin-binding protein 2